VSIDENVEGPRAIQAIQVLCYHFPEAYKEFIESAIDLYKEKVVK